MLATIHHHRTYIGAIVRHYGRCTVIGDMLELASELLWQDYLKAKGSSAVPYKRGFSQAYRKYCHEQMPRIVTRWILSYGCSEDYYYAHMMKLKHSAELFTFGKDSVEKFRKILEQKPAAKTYYPYDKREWDKLG